MTDKLKTDKTAHPEDKTPVGVNVSQYRSMIVSKLRADIAAKQAALATASVADLKQLQGMAYWKMAYWKMKYWKMGGINMQNFAVDPAPERN